MAQLQEFLRLKNLDLALPKANLAGKTVLITGANTGLGYEAARHLSKLKPAHLIITSRSHESGKAAIEKWEKEFQETKFRNWVVDLSDFRSVKAFAEKVEKELDRLDIFLANAGIAKSSKEITKDGYELTLQVNNISTAYLANRILPLIEKTATTHPDPDFKPHLSIVSSDVHYSIPDITYDESKGFFRSLSDEKEEDYIGADDAGNAKCRYSQSKAVNVLDTITLGKAASDNIIVNACNPGLCYSDLSRDMSGETKTNFEAFKEKYARTAEQGSRVLAWMAASETPSGAYVSNCEVVEPSEFVRSERGEEIRKKVWDEYQTIWKEIESAA